jgi:hypothetical protein
MISTQPIKKQSWLTACWIKIRDATYAAAASSIATSIINKVKK